MAYRGSIFGWAIGVVLMVVGEPARASFIGLGTGAQGYGLSSGGAVVVGKAIPPDQAFRWTIGTGAVPLGTFGGASSMAYDVSADGSTIVGYAYNSENNPRAFRWTSGGGMESIGSLSGSVHSYAYDVSGDGSVIAGLGYELDGFSVLPRAARWTAGSGMVSLGTLGGNSSQASGISDDGSIIVGWSPVAFGGMGYAFRWTEGGGMENLGAFPGDDGSQALSISADGSTIIGVSGGDVYTPTAKLIRWRSGTMEEMAKPVGSTFARTLGVSDDGNVVGGYANFSGTISAYVWSGLNEPVALSDILTAQGADLTGWELTAIESVVGSNGTYYVTGYGLRNGFSEGFVAMAVIPEANAAWFAALPVALVILRIRQRRRVA
jgi:probable HAF family extracellular repeat protein